MKPHRLCPPSALVSPRAATDAIGETGGARTVSLTGRLIWVGQECGRSRAMMGDPGAAPWKLGQVGLCMLCHSSACRAIVCAADAGQQEDLDGLSVEDQAAIWCSAMACDRAAFWQLTDEDRSDDNEVDCMATETMLACSYAGGVDGFADCWAEAHARLMNGEVRR